MYRLYWRISYLKGSPDVINCKFSIRTQKFDLLYIILGDSRWRSWLRHCATRRKVAGSIPDGVIGFFLTLFFRPHYVPGVNSASNRSEYQEYFLRGKGGRCVGLTTLQHSCADCLKIYGAWTSWNPQGLPRPVMGLLYLYLYLYLYIHVLKINWKV